MSAPLDDMRLMKWFLFRFWLITKPFSFTSCLFVETMFLSWLESSSIEWVASFMIMRSSLNFSALVSSLSDLE